MSEKNVKEVVGERAQEKEKEWPQILAVLIACMNALTGGVLFNWTSPTIPILIKPNDYLHVSMEKASYLAIIPAISLVLFAIAACVLIDKIGRKRCLQLIAVIQTISWVLIIIGESIWLLYLSRFLSGIGDTFTFATLPTYIGEVTTPGIRGSWGNAFALLLYIGAFLINVVGAHVGVRATGCWFVVVPVACFAALAFIPESPYYCAIKGREEEAIRSLRWLRGRNDVEEEYEEIATAVKRKLAESGTFKDLFTVRSNRRALFICSVLRFSQQFTGISAFGLYAQFMFNEAGGNLSASTQAAVLAALTILASFIGSVFLERLGRRKSMFFSGGGCTLTLFSIGVYFILKQHYDLTSIQWFLIAAMIVFVLFFSFGFGIVPTLMLGELFAPSIKGKALATMNVLNGILLASSTKIFQLLISRVGLWSPFVFFASTCLTGTIGCYFILQETSGKTLDEIQLELEGVKLNPKQNNPSNNQEDFKA